MQDLDWNTALWGADYDWIAGGEEWSAAWGGSEAQWFGSLFPRLHRLLPARRILEIAPGYGRWTKFLIAACGQYLGIDLAAACVSACSERFAALTHARFVQNDGLSLAAAEDGAFDFVFCFDSLVHAERDVLEAYIPQLLAKLTPDGVAFVHHSNLHQLVVPEGSHTHFRARSVSAAIVEDLVLRAGGTVIVQEIVNWPAPDSALIDCLTSFRRAGAGQAQTIRRVNPRFVEEAAIVAGFQAPYAALR